MARTVTLDFEARVALYLLHIANDYHLPTAPEAGEAYVDAAIQLLRGKSINEVREEIAKDIAELVEKAKENGYDASDIEDAPDANLGDDDSWRYTALENVDQDLAQAQTHSEHIAVDETLSFTELEEKYA